MSLLKFLGTLSPAHIYLFTLWHGKELVGRDVRGNKYYRGKPIAGYKRERRWVIYSTQPEASKIPPQWHGWIHHQTDIIPENDIPSFRRPWQKPCQENLTGTAAAYRPPGHALKEGRRPRATGDYEAWHPPE